jgi:hypothetical protein
LVLFAYPVALLLAMTTVISWPQPQAPRWRRLASGALLASVSFFRHDLLVYSLVLLTAIEGGHWLFRRTSFLTGSFRELTELVGALVTTLSIFWIPVLVTSGASATLHDLVLDQARLIQPARVLPIPRLLEWLDLGGLQMQVPGIFASKLRMCLVLAIGTAASAALALAWRVARESAAISNRTRLLALSTVFLLGTLPQGLQRTDYEHVAFGVPIVLATLGFIGGRRIAAPALLLALLPWFAGAPEFARLSTLQDIWHNRSDSRFILQDRRETVAFVRRATDENEPIFVGCDSHVRMTANSVDIYYFAKRPGATRYMQFDPGTVTTAAKQQQMIAELRRSNPRILLRESSCYGYEPNASEIPGAAVLDDYLAANYRPTGRAGAFAIWQRNDVPGAADQIRRSRAAGFKSVRQP